MDTETVARGASTVEKSAPPTYILSVSCPDRIGVVADVAAFLLAHNCNIVESSQFSDADNGRFFLRNAFQPRSGASLDALREAFAPLVERYEIKAGFFDAAAKVKTLVLVSKLGHCLNDLIFRHRIGALPIDIVGVVSNHPDFEGLVKSAGLSWDHLPVSAGTKTPQEAQIDRIAKARGVELIVPAA
ncbi:ACT domain-containing protein [Methylocella tundrae]|uniref:Formyltetrahydrofolate deformylase n=1 Tax=Methylocella tundrae TaxID=227605 RepID=A0A4U8Z732_METTU